MINFVAYFTALQAHRVDEIPKKHSQWTTEEMN